MRPGEPRDHPAHNQIDINRGRIECGKIDPGLGEAVMGLELDSRSGLGLHGVWSVLSVFVL